MKKSALFLCAASALLLTFLGCPSGGGGGAPDPGIEGLVMTFAGDIGVSGSTDFLGGTETARFNCPYGITSDGTNLYVADTENNVIRKIVIATGYVSTLAGLPNQPQAGSVDGTGPAARFYYPAGIVYYGGNLYVADRHNHQIRKIVAATGEVTTIAGTGTAGSLDGAGTAAQFNYPFGITTDGANLFVADHGNHTIRKIVIATKAVTTLAGLAGTSDSADGTSTAARFKNPVGIVRLGSYLYVADSGNYTIRRIAIASQAVTTYAGSAGTNVSVDGTGTAARFTLPSGIDTDGANLFVADANCIRKVAIAGAVVTTLAGAGTAGTADGVGADARFAFPRGLAPHDGFLYVLDTNNSTIRKVDLATAAVTTFAGEAGLVPPGSADSIPPRFFNPYGVACDGENLYVCDSFNHTIRKAVIATGVVTTLAGSAGVSGMADGLGPAARFNFPRGVATDGTNLYVCDSGSHTIRQVVISTGEVTTITGLPGTSGNADGAAEARFNLPLGIVLDGTNLYVADSGNFTIRKIDTLTNITTTIAGTGTAGSLDGAGTAASFNFPIGMTMLGGDIYVADRDNNTIRKVVSATGAVTTVAGSPLEFGHVDAAGGAARFQAPVGLTTDGTDLYIADSVNNVIRKIVLSTAAVTTLAGLAETPGTANGLGADARFNDPLGITCDGAYLYVADTANHAIRRIE